MGKGSKFLLLTVGVVAVWRLASELAEAGRNTSTHARASATTPTPAPGGSDSAAADAVHLDTPVRAGTAAAARVGAAWQRGFMLRMLLVLLALVGAGATVVAALQPQSPAAWLMMTGGVLTIVGTLGGIRVVRVIRMSDMRLASA